mmetsp:Transcript_2530/g.7491  ORF Transcript_2530/g.7491 Transcript_2530/m.7491 type:complete len:119 (-) Transcript_2530:514-870(-)
MAAARVPAVLAGLAGASGVAAGAYGAHGSIDEDSRATYETANKYHLLSAPALLGVAALVRNSPRSALQAVPAALLSTGTALFCGPLYHAALTGDRKMARVAPLGGVTMMAGWVACCLL